MTDASPSFGALIVVCGPPGVGKSTVATTLLDEFGGTHLRADEVRAELFDDPEYTAAADAATYEALFERAADALERGEHVVLDAPFADADRREEAENVAWRAGAEFRLLKVKADAERVAERRSRRDDASDADVEAYREVQAEFDAVPDDVTVIDNSGNVSETQRAVRRWLREGMGGHERDDRGRGF